MKKQINNEQRVLSTVVYSDLFACPLTRQEIRTFTGVRLSDAMTGKILASLYPVVQEHDGFYYLSGRDMIVARRHAGMTYAREKQLLARKVAQRLGSIPTVRFIGLSGSVASGNAGAQDDIDLFVITKAGTLFITRFFLLFLLQLSGLRRKRESRSYNNRICLNFLIDETQLAFTPDRHERYTAHEIAQLRPLFDRNSTYRRFIHANRWLYSFFPNFIGQQSIQEYPLSLRQRIGEQLMSLRIVEEGMKQWQIAMIRKHQTTETITHHFLAFHPRDYRRRTLNRYRKNMRHFEAKLWKIRGKKQHTFLDKAEFFFYTA